MLKNLMDIDEKIIKKKSKSKYQKELWVDIYKPTNKNELVVNKNKILELENLLYEKLSRSTTKPILLLTGPSGCGKTNSLMVIATQLGVQVKEWINPVTEEFCDKNEFRFFSDSQFTKFSDFLFRANRYQSLWSDKSNQNKKTVFLIKDFPNVVLRDPPSFHNLLQRYNTQSPNPLVLIVTDSDSSSNIKKLLFPDIVITNLSIDIIKFNPIPSTAMLKALQRFLKLSSFVSSSSSYIPTKQDLDVLIETSKGDLRSACNSLQFLSKKKKEKRKNNKKISKKKFLAQDVERWGGEGVRRDASLSLFRVLGKVLHCKRLPPDFNHNPSKSLTPLSFNPDLIFEKSHLSIDLYSAFLHQNFPTFLSSIDQITLAADYFSLSDTMGHEWSLRETSCPLRASLVTRGLLYANNQSESTSKGWVPLHKPQQIQCQKAQEELKSSVKQNFDLSLTPDLFTFHLPLLSSIVKLNQKNDLSFQQLQILRKIQNYNQNHKLERFEEKDGVEGEREERMEGRELREETEGTHLNPDSLDSVEPSCQEKEDFFIEEID